MHDYTAAAVTEETKPPSETTKSASEPSNAAPGQPPSGTPPSNDGGERVEGAEPQAAPDPLAEALAEATRFKDQLLRVAADFDNFRKRTRRELEEAERRGRDDLLKELLPVFDNIERAAAHVSSAEETGGVKALAEGIDLVLRQFLDTLKKLGIERVPSVGEPFDPAVHEAIQHLETSEFPPGMIAAEVQAGYRSAERLVRPALVVVAKAPSEAQRSDSGDGASGSEDAN